MDLKKLFSSGKKKTSSGDEPLTPSDLITLERYSEAADMLKMRTKKRPKDFRAMMQLAEVYLKLGKKDDAVETYLVVADGYTRDGFMDKSLAVLSKVNRLVPERDNVVKKMEAVRQAKRSERSRDAVAADIGQSGGGSSEQAFRLRQLWKNLVGSPLLVQLDDAQLKRLFGAAQLESLEKGEQLVGKGQQKEAIYIVAKGQVEAVVQRAENRSVTLRSFGPGDVIGDRALLEHQAWATTYRVAEDAEVLMIDAAGLEAALKGNPDPRSLLVALRSQRNDREVVAAMQKLGGGS